jgi:hypothetical protein
MVRTARQQHSRKRAKARRRWLRGSSGAGQSRREAWTRPLRRLRRAIASSRSLIDWTWRVIEDSDQSGNDRPIGASQDLQRAMRWLRTAQADLARAARGLRETNESIATAPERADAVPEMLIFATSEWILMATNLAMAMNRISELHHDLLEAMVNGDIVPELEWRPFRQRIIAAPRVNPVRAFLLIRRSSARDRISSVSVRRQRPAALPTADAPRKISRGRSPPPSSTCLL